MITKDKVSEFFCIADDFCKEFEVEMSKNALPASKDLICFHFNSYRNFKHYYL